MSGMMSDSDFTENVSNECLTLFTPDVHTRLSKIHVTYVRELFQFSHMNNHTIGLFVIQTEMFQGWILIFCGILKFYNLIIPFFSSRSNTDLGDADMEVSIIRGIQYNLPSGPCKTFFLIASRYNSYFWNECQS